LLKGIKYGETSFSNGRMDRTCETQLVEVEEQRVFVELELYKAYRQCSIYLSSGQIYERKFYALIELTT